MKSQKNILSFLLGILFVSITISNSYASTLSEPIEAPTPIKAAALILRAIVSQSIADGFHNQQLTEDFQIVLSLANSYLERRPRPDIELLSFQEHCDLRLLTAIVFVAKSNKDAIHNLHTFVNPKTVEAIHNFVALAKYEVDAPIIGAAGEQVKEKKFAQDLNGLAFYYGGSSKVAGSSKKQLMSSIKVEHKFEVELRPLELPQKSRFKEYLKSVVSFLGFKSKSNDIDLEKSAREILNSLIQSQTAGQVVNEINQAQLQNPIEVSEDSLRKVSRGCNQFLVDDYREFRL